VSVVLARPPPARDRRDRLIGVATFAAGCFWDAEHALRELPGVIETTVGYTGGTLRNPTYERVVTGTTGHVEAVQVEYDPGRVSYEELLERFWQLHEATRPRVGRRSRYRSAIFVHSLEQEQAARAALEARTTETGGPSLTEVRRAPLFYRAEDRHQRYLERR
jgi:peptide-methionine (S)-S-oxide reductase